MRWGWVRTGGPWWWGSVGEVGVTLGVALIRGGGISPTLTAAALQGSTTRLLATVTSSVGGRSHHRRLAALLHPLQVVFP